MSVDLELSVLEESNDERGYIAGFAITDEMIVAVGGTSKEGAIVLASPNTRTFDERDTPTEHGLRDVLAVADSIWVCGEYGQLALSRDHGESWTALETETKGCLFKLALGTDGAVWVVGDDGYAARVL